MIANPHSDAQHTLLEYFIGVAGGVASGMFSALSYIFIRQASKEKVHVGITTFGFGFIGMLVASVGFTQEFSERGEASIYDWYSMTLFFSIGTLSFFGQSLVTYAIQFEKPARLSPINMMQAIDRKSVV